MDIVKSFRSDSCRICPISYRALQTFCDPDKHQRNLQVVETVRPLPEDHTFKDQVASNFFYGLDSFHDFTSSGIIQRVLGSLMEIFYQDKLVSFNRNLIKFRSKKLEIFQKLAQINHRNQHISDIEEAGCLIKGTGTQQIDFFLMFGYLDETIDRSCEEWQIYELAREIYLFFDSDCIPRDQLDAIHAKIRQFHKLFYEKFVLTKLSTFTFKLHFLEHYPETVRHIGPIKNVKTLKYERNHQPIKNSEKGSRQFKNKPFSIAKWEALSMSVNYKLEDFEVKKRLRPSDFECPAIAQFRSFFDLGQEITQVKNLSIKKVPLFPGNFFRFKQVENNLPKFCKIVFTAKQGEDFVIVASVLETLEFIPHKFCYKVRYANQLQRVSVDELNYHQCTFMPLSPTEHCILQDFFIF